VDVQGVEVDHVDVGLHTGCQDAAIPHAVEVRGAAGLLRNDRLEIDPLAAGAIAHPVSEQEGRDAGIAEQTAVGATVREREDRLRVQHHLADRLEIAVRVADDRQVDETGSVVLHHHVVDHLERRSAFPCGDSRDALLGGRLVIGRVAEGEHHREALHDHHGRSGELSVVGLAVEDLRANRRVRELCPPLARRQVGNRLVARVCDEGVQGALPPQEQPGRTLGDLGGEATAFGVVLVDRFEQAAPLSRIRGTLQARERHGPSRLLAELAHPGELVAFGCEIARDFEDSVAHLAQHATDAEYLVVFGVRARHDLAGGREAEGAGLEALLHELRHLLDVFGGGLLVLRPSLAHHVRADRTVGDLGGDVDGAGHLLQRVEILGEALPVPLDAFGQRGAGNVLDTLHQLDQVVLLARAHGCEADSAVPHDHRGDPVPSGRRQVRVPGGLSVIVGVDIDPSGRDEETCRIDLAPPLAHVDSDGDDAIPVDRDIGSALLGSGAIDDGSTANYEVVHVLFSLLVSLP